MALNKAFCDRITAPGKYGDGRRNGLYLLVKPSGAKSWCQRITIKGRRCDLGLGSLRFYSLAEARETAFENQKVARRGGDPLASKRALAVPTFAEAMEAVIEIHGPSWQSPRAAQTWRQSLHDHATLLLDMRVDAITSSNVLTVLVPLWADRRDLAGRLKVRIGAVLKWAAAQGHRSDDPMPAVSAVLPRNGKTVNHHRTLPHAEIGAALERLRAVDAWPALALAVEFCALTAARSGEVRGAVWAEIDLAAKVWTIPASRMKGGVEHRVPLAPRALEILEEAKLLSGDNGLVFLSARNNELNDKTLRRLLDKADLTDAMTIHGLRSAFRDWAGDTGKPREIAEAALAHAAGGKVEAAYARSDLFARRVALMEAWAAYLSVSDAVVVKLRG